MLPNPPESSLKNCCSICGKPLESGLIPMPTAPGVAKKHCDGCDSDVCATHYSDSRKRCVRCTAGKDTWCKIPEMPKP